jgi:methyl-accepting chemotaxis protein
MRLSNLKVRTRLIIGFIAIAVLTAVVGIIGTISMKSMYENSDKMYHENFLPTQDLKEIQITFEQVRAQHIYALYDADPTKLQPRLDQIDSLITRTNELFDSYEKTIRTEEERTLFTNAKNSMLDYREARTVNLGLIKEGKVDEAIATIQGVTTTREQASKDLQALVDFNMQLSLDEVQNNENNYAKETFIMIVIIIATVAIAIIFGLILAGSISRPVNKMLAAANKLALGDVSVTIEENSRDEIGNLAAAFRKMIENIRNQAYATERIADGDLTVDVDVRSENDLLGRKLYELVQNNNEILTGITVAAEQVAVGARQVSDSSMALSQGATEQASSVEELTASLEEIASQTELNAQNANQANELAVNAKQNAVQGNSQMKEMLKAMVDINESSANISKVIKVIDDIAFQTNILALNAAVEAARAGQHGKGFAVVAEEVRNLAARSANAAKETTDMIESSIKKAEDGTRMAKNTADALDRIVTSIEKVAGLVGDIAVASNEQAMGITQINQGIMQVSQVVQTNSATSEESASASEELSSQASLLKETVGRYKLKKNVRNYGNPAEISPEVLMMLENMSGKKKYDMRQTEEPDRKSFSPTIVLSDKEFGKY